MIACLLCDECVLIGSTVLHSDLCRAHARVQQAPSSDDDLYRRRRLHSHGPVIPKRRAAAAAVPAPSTTDSFVKNATMVRPGSPSPTLNSAVQCSLAGFTISRHPGLMLCATPTEGCANDPPSLTDPNAANMVSPRSASVWATFQNKRPAVADDMGPR